MRRAWLILILFLFATRPSVANGQSHSFPHFHIRSVQNKAESKTAKTIEESATKKHDNNATTEQDSTFIDQTTHVLLKVVPDIRTLGMLPCKTEQEMRQKAKKRDEIVQVLVNSKSQCLEQNHKYINTVVNYLKDNKSIICSPSDEKNLYGKTVRYGSMHSCKNIINYINLIIQKL